MATIACQGKILIDLVDFWSYAETVCPDMGIVQAAEFSVEGDCILMQSGSHIYQIDAADFWVWVGDEHLNGLRSSAEVVYGVPSFDLAKGELSISFAYDTSNNPRNWPIPPSCLDEWTWARSLSQKASSTPDPLLGAASLIYETISHDRARFIEEIIRRLEIGYNRADKLFAAVSKPKT